MCRSGSLQRLWFRIRRSDFQPKAAQSGPENALPIAERGVETLLSGGVKGGGCSCFLARPLPCQRHFGCGALRCRGSCRRIDHPTPGDSILPSHLRHSAGPLRNLNWSWSPTSLHSTRVRWPFNLCSKMPNWHLDPIAARSSGRQRQPANWIELFDQGVPHGLPAILGKPRPSGRDIESGCTALDCLCRGDHQVLALDHRVCRVPTGRGARIACAVRPARMGPVAGTHRGTL
jgi:hypothetical protein